MDAKSTIHFTEMLYNSTAASIHKTRIQKVLNEVLAYLVPSFRTFVTRLSTGFPNQLIACVPNLHTVYSLHVVCKFVTQAVWLLHSSTAQLDYFTLFDSTTL